MPLSKPLILCAVVLLAAACKTTVDPFTQDLTPDQYFQRAIDASERDEYKLALSYYQAFQAKYPADEARNAWASYEIAMLYHKLGDDAKAVELFTELVARYQDQKEGAAPLPPGPRALAERVKANILKAANPAGAKPLGPGAAPATPPATPAAPSAPPPVAPR